MDTVLGHFQVIFASFSSLVCIFVFSYLMRKCDVRPLSVEKGHKYCIGPGTQSLSSRMKLVPLSLKHWDLLASLGLLLLLILSSQILSFMLLNSVLLGFMNVCPLIMLVSLRKMPREERSLDDTLELWMSFAPPLLCTYSFYSTNILFNSLNLPAVGHSVGQKLLYLKDLLYQPSDKTTIPIIICCFTALALIYASLALFIFHCTLKTQNLALWDQSDSWALNLWRSMSDASLPRALLTSMTLALTSLLFSTGAIIYRWPLIIESLVR